MYEHTLTLKCEASSIIVAYVVSKKSRDTLKLEQKIVARVYGLPANSPNGYILQKEQTNIGSLGAYWLPYVSIDVNDHNLLAKAKQVCDIYPLRSYAGCCDDEKVKFRLIEGYVGDEEQPRTYELWSEQYCKNFGRALAGTGIANRYIGKDPLRGKPLHVAEAVDLDDLSMIEPTGWIPMM